MLQDMDGPPELYARYVDDIFVCVRDEEHLKTLKTAFEEASVLRFTYEVGGNKIAFLDTMVEKLDDGMCSTSVYRKTTDEGHCLSAQSECPERYKLSVIKAFVRRAVNNSSSWQHVHAELTRSRQILVNNGYSNHLVDNEIKRQLDACHQRSEKGEQSEQQEREESGQKNDEKSQDKTEKTEKIKLFYRSQMNTAYKTEERVIRDLILTNVKPTDKAKKVTLIIYYNTRKTADLVMVNNMFKKKTRDKDNRHLQQANLQAEQAQRAAAAKAELARRLAEADAEQARRQAEAQAEQARRQAEAQAEQARRQAEAQAEQARREAEVRAEQAEAQAALEAQAAKDEAECRQLELELLEQEERGSQHPRSSAAPSVAGLPVAATEPPALVDVSRQTDESTTRTRQWLAQSQLHVPPVDTAPVGTLPPPAVRLQHPSRDDTRAVPHLPRITLEKFGGSAIEWPRWIALFKALVHDRADLTDVERLTYLQTHLTGPARESVRGMLCDASLYSTALCELEREFGDPSRVIHATMKRLLTARPVKDGDLSALTELSRELHTAVSVLQCLHYEHDLAAATNVTTVTGKLPASLAWRAWGVIWSTCVLTGPNAPGRPPPAGSAVRGETTTTARLRRRNGAGVVRFD
ncbi:hypothetical protein FJT64_009204 [Amphibalanus amphitrite]|uniref:Helix-turn-helix domain-containing protein n=1 Tax=Amphibalanus amphitrite TaxID=1232801 RepID=A0A6A4VEI2_AMPAM|nr:hypothetical protein FJT64_009204 [Amphibalanus amphitrite]